VSLDISGQLLHSFLFCDIVKNMNTHQFQRFFVAGFSVAVILVPSFASAQIVGDVQSHTSATVSPRFISVLSPNGGETLQKGTSQKIRWSSKNMTRKINISLVPYFSCNTSCPPSQPSYVIKNGAPNTGEYVWSVGMVTNLAGGIVPDGTYTIQICGRTDTPVCDSSDAYFTITSPASAVGALNVTVDPSTAPANQIVMGSVGNNLATFRLRETSGAEGVSASNITILDTIQSSTVSVPKQSFTAIFLYNGSTLVGIATFGTAVPGGYSYQLSSPGLVIPKGGFLLLTLRGDVDTYASGGADDNSVHTFNMTGVTATGVTSGAPVSSTPAFPPPSANPMTILRTKLTLTANPLGSYVGRAKSSADNLATLTLAADPAGDLALNALTITFGGTAPVNSAFLDGVTLIDENAAALGTGSTTSTACNGLNTCSKTFNLGATTSGQAVVRGASRAWTLRADTNRTQAGAPGISQSLDATINASTDVQYTDGLDPAAVSGIPLSGSTLVPLWINVVSYAVGT